IAQLPLRHHPNVQLKPIRLLISDPDPYNAIALISEHSTNHRLVKLIRQHNILTPIYIIPKNVPSLNGINGYIQKQEVTYDTLQHCIINYPQASIWNYVFDYDNANRTI
ncbi:MAG: hypothetical protein ACO3K7_04990, partial [Candidatus Marinamargulisbacteria bacterium]